MSTNLALLLVAAAALAPAATNEGITREQADAILNELRQIRQLLQRGMQPPQGQPSEPVKAALKIEGGPFLGSKDAPITIVEYTDAQCPFCRQFHLTTFEDLRKKHIDTGKVRFYSRDLPLDFHANAMSAAEAGRCAGEQNRYWELRDRLIENANRLARPDIDGYAQTLGLDMAKFKACMDSGKHRAAIQQDIAEAGRLGVNGTPSFVIGKSTPEGVDGVLLVGARPLAAFEAVMKQFE
jgi:protein-disulfide isomerase